MWSELKKLYLNSLASIFFSFSSRAGFSENILYLPYLVMYLLSSRNDFHSRSLNKKVCQYLFNVM